MTDPTIRSVLQEYESPQEALLHLADVVELCIHKLSEIESEQTPTSDAWSTWDDQPLVDDSSSEWHEPPGVREELAALQGELSGCEDDEESKVLRAKIELAEDKLVPPADFHDNTGEASTVSDDQEGASTVDVPKPTPDQEDEREEFAREILRLEEVYGEERGAEYIQSYRKAGPALLYYTDRDFVLGLPDDIKRAMVGDVERFSPKEAHEIARDILKDLDPGGPDVTVENLVKTMAAASGD